MMVHVRSLIRKCLFSTRAARSGDQIHDRSIMSGRQVAVSGGHGDRLMPRGLLDMPG